MESVIDKTEVKHTEETGTQTCAVIPYEHLLVGILSQRNNEQHQPLRQNSDCRLSPSSMLDRYVEACARFGSTSNGGKKLTEFHIENEKKNIYIFTEI